MALDRMTHDTERISRIWRWRNKYRKRFIAGSTMGY
jgi:hypothetical protein